MKLWDFKVGCDRLFQDYHRLSINDPIYTSMQVYKHTDRIPEPVEGAVLHPMNYVPDSKQGFERSMMQRHTWPYPFPNEQTIDLLLISRFTQLAFIAHDREGRAYPSGGARYYVNIHMLFNEARVAEPLGRWNVCQVDPDRSFLAGRKSVPWNTIEQAYIQRESAATAQFAVVLTADLDSISAKYPDISYKLVQQEAGHIGQNIQLVANYLGIRSLPLGGFYDVPLGQVVGTGDDVLYSFLLG